MTTFTIFIAVQLAVLTVGRVFALGTGRFHERTARTTAFDLFFDLGVLIWAVVLLTRVLS